METDQVQVDTNKTEIFLAIRYNSIRKNAILHLTLFDVDNEPVAKRLMFIDQHSPTYGTMLRNQVLL